MLNQIALPHIKITEVLSKSHLLHESTTAKMQELTLLNIYIGAVYQGKDYYVNSNLKV